MLVNELLEKLRCVECKGELNRPEDSNQLYCLSCSRSYAIEEGVPSLAFSLAADQEWNSWDSEEILKMGQSYVDRVTGKLPEKEASKSYANLMREKGLHTPGDSLLDIGSACGHFYRSFRDRLDEEIDYTGVDITLEFLQWGRSLYKDNPNVNFVHCDALHLPFADRSFDTVIVNLFHFFPTLDEPLREAMRVAEKRVIWRTPIGHNNYAVKIIHGNDFNALGVIAPNRDDYDYTLWMAYTPEYLSGLISHLGGRVEFIQRDEDFEDFNNNDLDSMTQPASKATGGVQTHGNLLLNWHYVSIVPS